MDAAGQTGKPKKIHVCCVIAVPEGIEFVKKSLPEDSTNPLSPKHWYYLDTSDGHMLTNVTIDGHTYGADGREIGT